MEIAEDPAQNKIRLKADLIRWPLQWSEMEYSKGLRPVGLGDNTAEAWVFTLK